MQKTGAIRGRLEKPSSRTEYTTYVEIVGITAPYFEASANVVSRDPIFAFDKVPPGQYAVYANSYRNFVQVPLDKVLVESGKTAEIAINLAKGFHVRGRIVDAKTGSGVSEAALSVTWKGLPTRRIDSANGSGSFDIILAPGDYTLFVYPPDLLPTLPRPGRGLARPAPKPYVIPDAPVVFSVKEGADLTLPDIKLVPKESAAEEPRKTEAKETAPAAPSSSKL
jgi:hypothetical protein